MQKLLFFIRVDGGAKFHNLEQRKKYFRRNIQCSAYKIQITNFTCSAEYGAGVFMMKSVRKMT